MLKVGFFGVKNWEREAIEKEITSLSVYGVGIYEEEVQDAIEKAAEYDIISTFIYSKVDKAIFEQLPKLKLIATRSTGVDHIACDVAKQKCVEVKNVPEYGTHTVAEFTWALILATTKKIVPAAESVAEGEFNPSGLTGVDLWGKTLGVIGAGKIGTEVIRLGKVFGMKVIVNEKKDDPVRAKELGYEMVDLETLLKTADVITLHVPSIPDTYHLINKTNIKIVKPGAYLVNTCRGPVVETAALLWALNKKILAGVGLDVVEEEQNIENISMVTSGKMSSEDAHDLLSYHMLRDRDDVVFTPHNAFNTQEAIGRIVATTVENINQFINSYKE